MSVQRIAVIFRTLCSIAFIVNIFGNILVCLVVKRCKNLQNITSFLLVNLALGDLSLGLCGSIHLIVSSTIHSELICSIASAAVYLSATVSAYTIAVLAIERCIAITRPFYSRCHTSTSKLKVILPVIWVISGLVSFPSLVFFIGDDNSKKMLPCWDALTQDDFPSYYKIILLVFMYLIPMGAIGISYWKIIRYALRLYFGVIFLMVLLLVIVWSCITHFV